MVQFVNIREFKTDTDAVLRKLERSDVVLTLHGKPKALLHKISEGDLSLREEFSAEEWEKLERLAEGPGKSYKTGAQFLKALKRL
jgi:hypothetical protein